MSDRSRDPSYCARKAYLATVYGPELVEGSLLCTIVQLAREEGGLGGGTGSSGRMHRMSRKVEACPGRNRPGAEGDS